MGVLEARASFRVLASAFCDRWDNSDVARATGNRQGQAEASEIAREVYNEGLDRSRVQISIYLHNFFTCTIYEKYPIAAECFSMAMNLLIWITAKKTIDSEF